MREVCNGYREGKEEGKKDVGFFYLFDPSHMGNLKKLEVQEEILGVQEENPSLSFNFTVVHLHDISLSTRFILL